MSTNAELIAEQLLGAIDAQKVWGDLIVNVKSYGAKGNGSTDDTAAIQRAINDAANGVLVFPSGGNQYKVGKLYISKPMIVLGNGSVLLGSDNAIFCVAADLDYLHIGGFEALFPNAIGNQGREFFVNIKVNGVIGENTIFYPGGVGKDVVEYNVLRLSIMNCKLNMCKVTVCGPNTVFRIENNEWFNNSTVTTAPAYLDIYKGQDIMVKTTNGWIVNNRFVVYPPNSSNQDIVKIGGGTRSVVMSGNYIKNTNPACFAQVDVFTGGDRARFINNTLINVQYHRKQVQGEIGAVPLINYDLIHGNFVEIEDGHLLDTAFYLVGSLFTVSNNQVLSSNKSRAQIGFYLDDSDSIYDSFNTRSTAAFMLNNNIADFRNAHATSYFLQYDTGSGTAVGLGSIASNLLVGGARFCSGFPKYCSFVGNVWGISSGATGTSFVNTGAPGIAVGNISDSDAPIVLGISQGNYATQTFPTINTATDTTPAVDGASRFSVSGGGTITNFLNGKNGQEITLITTGGGCTVAHNSNIRLNASANFVMAARATLTLVKFSDGVWIEVSRSSP